MNEEDFVAKRLEKSIEDFTSLGRWGWGLVIAFLSQVVLKSVEKEGLFFPNIRCPNADAVGFLFFAVLVIATIVYSYFLWRAKQQVVTCRTYASTLADRLNSPAMRFAVQLAPDDRALLIAMILRAAMFLVLFVVWVSVFDVFEGPPKDCGKWVRTL